MTPEPFLSSPRDFAASDMFARTFSEGMDLVEETAAYLEGPGRRAAKALTRSGALAYAGESMRLTTQLMQVASWLLVHRAVRDGEMSEIEAREQRYRLNDEERVAAPCLDGTEELPEALMALGGRADRLYARVARIDVSLFGEAVAAPGANPVADQLGILASVFNDR